MKQRQLIISILLHALLLIVVYIFQSMIFPFMRIAGLVPLLLPIVSTGVALYEGRYVGGVTGLFAGILTDLSFNQAIGPFTLLLTLTSLVVGTLADIVVLRGFVTFFLASFAVLIVSASVQMFPLIVFHNIPVTSLLGTAVAQTIYSLVFVLPIWFFVRSLGLRSERYTPTN